MKLTLIFLLVVCLASVTLACNKKCREKKKAAALQKACAAIGGGTKIKLEIDIAGGGCRPPCKKKKKGQDEAEEEAQAGDDAQGDQQNK
jgi:hypothetical protein